MNTPTDDNDATAGVADVDADREKRLAEWAAAYPDAVDALLRLAVNAYTNHMAKTTAAKTAAVGDATEDAIKAQEPEDRIGPIVRALQELDASADRQRHGTAAEAMERAQKPNRTPTTNAAETPASRHIKPFPPRLPTREAYAARDQQIAQLRAQGETYAALGRRFGVSTKRVEQIVARQAQLARRSASRNTAQTNP